jgi:phage regulator Rha-like protein
MMTTSNNDQLTMSSREIAEVVESRHDNVKITIERLGVKGIVTFTATQEPTLGGGKPVTVYHVNKRDSHVVVAQLSPEFTARLVDRWQELEKQVAQPQVPQSFAQALRLAADTQEQLEQAEEKNATYEKVIGTNRHSLSKFARTLPGLNSNKLKSDLMFFEYLYYRGGSYKRYSKFAHLFEEKHHEEYGSVEIYPTEKGKQRILELYERGALTMKKAWQK